MKLRSQPLKDFEFVKNEPTMLLQQNIVEDGEIVDTKVIGNFWSVVTSQTYYINYTGEKEVTLTIVTTGPTGVKFDPIQIKASDLESLNWIKDNYGMKVRLVNGRTIRELFLESIWYFSKKIKEEVVYGHTGYIERQSKTVYLSGGETIDENGIVKDVTCSLPNELKNYILPRPLKKPGNKKKYAKHFRLLLNISSKNPLIGVFLLSIVARPALNIFTRANFVVFIAGITGTKKSSIAAVCQSFFGPGFSYDNLPANWTSTPNSIERLTQIVLDSLLVIDDFKYGSSQKVADSNDGMDRIVRGTANGSVRQRLTDFNSRLSAPRAMILSTGEVIPEGQGIDPSMYYRMCFLTLINGDIDDSILTKLQELGKNGDLAQSMSNYTQYILQHADKLKELYKKTFLSAKTFIKSNTNIPTERVIDNFASLIAATRVNLKFMHEQGAITSKQAKELYLTCKSNLTQLAGNQHDIISKSNILNIVNQALEKALQEGVCVLRDASSNNVIPLQLSGNTTNLDTMHEAETAGWLDPKTGDIYLDREFDIHKLFDYIPREFRHITELPVNSFWILMRKNNCLKSLRKSAGGSRNNIRKTFQGKQQVVYHTRFSVKLPK